MSLLFDFLFGLVLIIVIVGLVQPSLLTNKKTGETVKRSDAVKAGAIVLPVLALMSCIFSEAPKMPDNGTLTERIQFLASNVSEVNDLDDRIMIVWLPETVESGRGWVWSFFTDAEKILKNLNEASRGKAYEEVSFLVKVPLRTNLGKEHSVTGMKVFYDGATLKQVNWEKMTTFDVMEIPFKVTMNGHHGHSLAIEYCKDGENFKHSIKFCSVAAAS